MRKVRVRVLRSGEIRSVDWAEAEEMIEHGLAVRVCETTSDSPRESRGEAYCADVSYG